MLSVEEAQAAVLSYAKALAPRRVALLDAIGCRLAEKICADADSPPFDRAIVDGFAVRSAELTAAKAYPLRIGEEITAGRVPSRPLGPAEAASIMTGAPLPVGADAVIMHEKTKRDSEGRVLVPGPVTSGEGRMARGREMKAGQSLFAEGTVVNPAVAGVLATVGKAQVFVYPKPRVAIVPTGDELVPIESVPGPGQIRETNSVMLAACLNLCGALAVRYPAAADEPELLRQALAQAVAPDSDVLIVCGGVSAGKKDLVPAAVSVARISDQVSQSASQARKTASVCRRSAARLCAHVMRTTDRRRSRGRPALLFGLPGNPVSALVGFHLFIRPALEKLVREPIAFSNLGAPARQVLPSIAAIDQRFTRRRSTSRTANPASEHGE